MVPGWITEAVAEAKELDRQREREREQERQAYAASCRRHLEDDLTRILPNWEERLRLETCFTGRNTSWPMAVKYDHEYPLLRVLGTNIGVAVGSSEEGVLSLYSETLHDHLLFEYGQSATDNWRKLAVFVDCILQQQSVPMVAR